MSTAVRDSRGSRERTRSRERRLSSLAFASHSVPNCRPMEEEDEEARALLGDRPEGDSAVRGAPRALPALCDPSHLAHRLVVLLLMCFLGFGEPWRGREGRSRDSGVRVPGSALPPRRGTPSIQWSRARAGDRAGDFPECSRFLPGDGGELESQLFVPEHCAQETSERCSNPSPSLPQATSPHPTARAFLGVFLSSRTGFGFTVPCWQPNTRRLFLPFLCEAALRDPTCLEGFCFT